MRRAIEELAQSDFPAGAFVVAGLGSLAGCRLRFAGQSEESAFSGDFEILSLSGTVTMAGAHLHMMVADSHGRVLGGHVCHGNLVRTTVELLLLQPQGWRLERRHDPSTGHKELVVARVASHGQEDA